MGHYIIAQPASLESWALKELVKWIAEKLAALLMEWERTHPNKVQDFTSWRTEIIRNHLELKLPGMFHDKAMVEYETHFYDPMTSNLYSYEIRLAVHSHMIETLFTKNLTSLSLSFCDQERFCSKMHLVTGLIDLSINYSVLTEDILECIANNCKLIENLDFLETKGLTDASLNVLVRLSKLKSIGLSFTGVSETGIQNVLTICPNIECIQTEFDVAQALVNIAKAEGNERLFNLKTYTFCRNTNTTLELQQALVKMCPAIEKVILSYSCHFINVFRELKNVNELQLSCIKFYSDEVKELLQAVGSKLVSLHLFMISEMDFSAMECIYLSCPNLQNLDIKACTFEEEGISPYGEGIEFSPLKYLKRISVLRNEGWWGPWGKVYPDALNSYILSNCLVVEYLYLSGPCVNSLIYILENHPEELKYLKHLTYHIEFDEFDRALSKKAKAAIDWFVQNSICPLELVIE